MQSRWEHRMFPTLVPLIRQLSMGKTPVLKSWNIPLHHRDRDRQHETNKRLHWHHSPSPKAGEALHREGPATASWVAWESPRWTSSTATIVGCFSGSPLGLTLQDLNTGDQRAMEKESGAYSNHGQTLAYQVPTAVTPNYKAQPKILLIYRANSDPVRPENSARRGSARFRTPNNNSYWPWNQFCHSAWKIDSLIYFWV